MTHNIRHIGPQVIGSGVKRDFWLVVDGDGQTVTRHTSRADAVRERDALNGIPVFEPAVQEDRK